MSRFPWQSKLLSPSRKVRETTLDSGLMYSARSYADAPNQKKGRRRSSGITSGLFQLSPTKHDDDDIGTSEDLLGSPGASPDRDYMGAPRPSRRTGGWADEVPKSGKNRRAPQLEIEDERLKFTSDYDSDNEMPLIPDLDDVQEEDLATQVAEAPHVLVNRVATYKELDNDLLKHAAFSTLDDIDLRVLMKCLVPESEVKEDDVPWTWDVLFTEVTSELNTEWESHNTAERSTSP